MASLGNPKKTVEIIKKYDFVFQKKYGQNFLIDSNILEKIISSAKIDKDDFVIEIGPGIGTLTQYLCESAREVLAIEIDKMLIPILEDTLNEYKNVSILNQDILKTDIKEIIKRRNNNQQVKVVANLPYYITTPIVMELLENDLPIESITIMVQKEVADRMRALANTKEYGALSLGVQFYSLPEIIASVSPNCFIPKPKVGSSVIKLTVNKEDRYKVLNKKLLFKIIKAGFNQRRKTLINSVANANINGLSKDIISEALLELGFSNNIRAENLSISEYVKFTNILCNKIMTS